MLKAILRPAFDLLLGFFSNRANKATAEFVDYLFKVRSQAGPLKIELVPVAGAQWLESPAVKDIVQQLHVADFSSEGVWSPKGNGRTVIAGFCSLTHSAWAEITPGKKGSVNIGFTCHYEDGTCFDCSTTPLPFEPPCPEWMVRQRLVGASFPQLWDLFLKTRPQKRLKTLIRGQLASVMAEDFSRYQAWMAERGGKTREELRVQFEASGQLPKGEERNEFLNAVQNNEFNKAMCQWWRLQADAPVPLEQVMKPLVIIHDGMAIDILVNAYWCATHDFKAKARVFEGGTPREAFARVLSERGNSLRKVFVKNTLPGADFYLPE